MNCGPVKAILPAFTEYGYKKVLINSKNSQDIRIEKPGNK
jgi:hypothetical protein